MVVLATVAVPPWTGIAPPLITIVPAALRPTVIELFKLSPNTLRRPEVGLNEAVTARRRRDSRDSTVLGRRSLDRRLFMIVLHIEDAKHNSRGRRRISTCSG